MCFRSLAGGGKEGVCALCLFLRRALPPSRPCPLCGTHMRVDRPYFIEGIGSELMKRRSRYQWDTDSPIDVEDALYSCPRCHGGLRCIRCGRTSGIATFPGPQYAIRRTFLGMKRALCDVCIALPVSMRGLPSDPSQPLPSKRVCGGFTGASSSDEHYAHVYQSLARSPRQLAFYTRDRLWCWQTEMGYERQGSSRLECSEALSSMIRSEMASHGTATLPPTLIEALAFLDRNGRL
ncbi:MAG: hypothetical protein WC483_03535 [Candidatus Paceibacterota bacterium]